MLTRKVKLGDLITVCNMVYSIVGFANHGRVSMMQESNFIVQPNSVFVKDPFDITESELKLLIVGLGHTSDDYPTVKFFDGTPVFKETRYQMGDRFKLRSKLTPLTDLSTEEYILASTGSKQATLISLTDGNRWEEPVDYNHVVNKGLTKEELELIIGSNYTFVRL